MPPLNHVFGSVVPALKKNEVWNSMYFQVLPGHFYFVRGHSLVELTEQDSSAADIMVHSVYMYVLLTTFW